MSGIVIYGRIEGSVINIHLTEDAMNYLNENKKPLYVGMELSFASFLQKKVYFYTEKPEFEVTKVADNLFIYFRSVQIQRSKIKDLNGQSPELVNLPVTRKGALIPKYAKIDRKKGEWIGDFTWKTGNQHLKPLIFNYN